MKWSQSQCGIANSDSSWPPRCRDDGNCDISGIRLSDGDATIDCPKRIEKTKSSEEPFWLSAGGVRASIAARLSSSASCSLTSSSIASAIALPKNAMSESIGKSINQSFVRHTRRPTTRVGGETGQCNQIFICRDAR